MNGVFKESLTKAISAEYLTEHSPLSLEAVKEIVSNSVQTINRRPCTVTRSIPDELFHKPISAIDRDAIYARNAGNNSFTLNQKQKPKLRFVTEGLDYTLQVDYGSQEICEKQAVQPEQKEPYNYIFTRQGVLKGNLRLNRRKSPQYLTKKRDDTGTLTANLTAA